MAKRKPWSKLIEHRGVTVRLYQRGAVLWRSVVVGRTVSATGKARAVEDRRSLEHSDRALAERQARALADAICEQQLRGHVAGNLTLGQLFGAYRQHRFGSLTPARQKEANSRMAMFLDAWSADLPVSDIDQTRVHAYAAGRRSLAIIAPGLKPDSDGKPRRGYRAPQPARDGAIDGEFRTLNAILNWACGFKSNGRQLLDKNPIPRRGQDRRALGWPVERNPRQPVAGQDRYARTQEHTGAVDPMGRLRCIVALARFTGRRESAICALYASDLLLSPDRVRAALADAGRNEQDAEHMPFGAIRWRDESDKVGYLFISPISSATRAELDLYVRRSARVGDVPLFPAPGRKPKKGAPPPTTPPKPMSRETAASWLVKAERLAGLPKLRGGVFHPYRRLWAIERQHLPAIEVAEAGGWGDTQALTRIYQKATAKGVLQAVTG